MRIFVELALAVFVTVCSAYNNGVGARPPMGWNTWCTDDICGAIDKCSAKLVKEVADAIVEQGLDKLGYEYVNMDDCWSAKERTSSGELQPDPDRFPLGMKDLAEHVHSRGLKLGVYTCIGTKTCRGGKPGSYGHFEQDARTLAAWGVDFVKADNCARAASGKESYTNFSRALNATGHPFLFSLCNWGDEDVLSWGADVGQMFRVQMDHLPLWHFPPKAAGQGYGQGTSDIIEYFASLKPSQFIKQYGWLDPDFCETLFPSLPWIDSRTEYTFWALWSSPILVATDLRKLSEAKRKIVANPEVIAINQDPLWTAGGRLANYSNGGQVWGKPLHGGDIAVVLYNPHEVEPLHIPFSWTMLGLPSDQNMTIRDLWNREDLGTAAGSYNLLTFPHDVHFLRLKKV